LTSGVVGDGVKYMIINSRTTEVALMDVGMNAVPTKLYLITAKIYRRCFFAPSSRFVPAINGTRANTPAAYTFDGKSGKIPPGPSIVGGKGISSPARIVGTDEIAFRSDADPAVFRHGKVLAD
jgi:hypothetical protein